MSEDAPQIAANVQPLEDARHIGGFNAPEGDPTRVDPESSAVEPDPSKAYEMAMAGDENRTRAVEHRQQANKMMSSTTTGEQGLAIKTFQAEKLVAKMNDEDAESSEKVASREYDRQNLPFTADELVETLESAAGSDAETYLKENVLDNSGLWKANPDLAKDVCDKLVSVGELVDASSIAAVLIEENIDKHKGIDVLVKTLNSEDVIMAQYGLEYLGGDKQFFGLPIEDAWPLIQAYAAATKRVEAELKNR